MRRSRTCSVLMASCAALFWECGPGEKQPASKTPPAPKPGRPAVRTARPAGPPARPAVRRPGPPPARRQNIVDVIHGVKVHDPYRWLEDVKSAETQTWLKRMAAFARKKLDRLPGRALLHKRLKELSYLEWVSPPRRRGRRYFFARQHKDKEKVVYYWRQGTRGKLKVLIDPNKLSKDGSIALRGGSVDYQGRNFAYKLSLNNADESTLYVKDVATNKKSSIDVIPGAKYAYPSWTPKGDGFYYTRLPTDKTIKVADRPGHAAVYFHKLGTDPKTDNLIHPKTGDPRKFIGPSLSRDGRFLFIYISHGWISTDVYLKDFRAQNREDRKRFRPFVVGRKARYYCFAWKGKIYVYTNDGAPNYRLYKVDPRKLDRKHWREIVPERKDGVLTSFVVRGNRLALQYMHKVSTQLRISTLNGKVIRNVAFPGIGTASQLSGNPKDDTAYYSFSSFVRPRTVYRTSIRKGGRKVYFQLKAPVDPKPFTVEQVFYASKDGTKVSMFIIRPKKIPMDGSTPMLLYGYGGFNHSLTPRFRARYFTWLEQGGAVAIPNLRGGGEYGENWHRAGMLLKKQNTFDDFIAAAEYLIRKRYTSPAKLAIRGGSNGGLLVGAAMTQRPELFRAVACHVPLMDMVRYHLFGSGKTWISEYGSAKDPKQFKVLHGYSPYHRVRRDTAYPALVMFTADSDDRVDPMHARKFVAAVRWASKSPHPVLLRLETKAGHGGGDMIKKRVARTTDEFAFLLNELGVTPRPRPATMEPAR